MSYYGDAQWPAGGQPTAWDHQTPPTRSGASSTIPREESAAFFHQFEEVERATENLIKSGKMFGPPGGRHPRGPGGPQRPHSVEFDGRSGPPSSNIQNFYASQRHQSSRGSNEAEQVIQHKRRMAAQRERELRNYHQEQQFNRTAFTDMQLGAPGPASVTPGPGPAGPGAPGPGPGPNRAAERTLSPGSMSEDARRELIARQRNALYGEGPFGDATGYIDETGTPRQGLPIHHAAPGGAGSNNSLRGPSPLAYEYGRNPPSGAHPDAGAGGPPSSAVDPSSSAVLGGLQQPRDRTSSNASPQSNPPGAPKGGPLEHVNRTSNSSPGGGATGSPQNNGKHVGGGAGGKAAVAPIGTRPSVSTSSPLNHGYSAPGDAASSNTVAAAAASSSSGGAGGPASTTGGGDAPSSGLSGWGQRAGWGPKAQTSVWG